jgi:cbb3-type cytochrome oxidase maturation protein
VEVIFGLVGVTVILVILITLVLLWAVRSGQFDDLEGPAWRVLMDDDAPKKPADPPPEKTED